ncbi:MAG: VOC family protein [Opitutus sp.]|nr:VOC family protein [Opitutus sp.]
MTFEYFALNVADARAHGDWYVQHLGFKIVRRLDEPPFRRFLADGTGRVVVELYTDPRAGIPDYATTHPLCFHFAVVSTDAHADCRRLEVAGATHVTPDEPQADSTRLVMMRDPWGVSLQLCQRANPF